MFLVNATTKYTAFLIVLFSENVAFMLLCVYIRRSEIVRSSTYYIEQCAQMEWRFKPIFDHICPRAIYFKKTKTVRRKNR